MMASYNGGPNQVFFWGGAIFTWMDVTPATMAVDEIAAAGDVLVIEGFQMGDTTRIWQYGLVPDAWIPSTATNTTPKGFVVQDGSVAHCS